MPLTVALSGDWMTSLGNKRQTHGTITFDSSYLTGGEAITAAMLGLGLLENLQLKQGEDGLVASWDRSAGTIQLFDEAGADGPLSEVGSTSNQSAVVLDFVAVGR